MDHDFTIEPMLESELYTTPPLMRVVVARLNGSQQDIPKAFELTKSSNADLKHLRRVRDLENGSIECIICKVNKLGDEENFLKNVKDKFEHENMFDDFRLMSVPSKAPRTEHQLAACSKIWPCKYAKCNYLNRCIAGTLFQKSERLVLKIIVTEILKMINGQVQAAAVVFESTKVHGVGLTNEETIKMNPIKHSTMIAIDSVAANSGAGHWDNTHDHNATMLAKRIQQELDTHCGHLVDDRSEPDDVAYLCTNYDIIVTEQPCLMCAMGLVQSRIRRLFYLDGSKHSKRCCFDDGAIENFLVHRSKSLNHKFEAWRIRMMSKVD